VIFGKEEKNDFKQNITCGHKVFGQFSKYNINSFGGQLELPMEDCLF
jgi:hypothetical protein